MISRITLIVACALMLSGCEFPLHIASGLLSITPPNNQAWHPSDLFGKSGGGHSLFGNSSHEYSDFPLPPDP